MPLSLEQVQIQTQRLVMTPQMQLSVKLLQMNTLEMEQLARQEILENPFLEMDEEEEEPEGANPTNEPDAETPTAEASASTDVADPIEATEKDPGEVEPAEAPSGPEEIADPVAGSLDSNDGAETFEHVDVEWDDYFEESERRFASVREEPEEERDFTEYTASRRSLYDYLMWQLHVSALEGKDGEIGECLIGNIDDNGYLTATVEEVAQNLQVSPQQVEHVLGIIQTFDPTGVGARDLTECLLIQLESRGLKDPIYREILTKHFAHLGQQRFRDIARALHVDEERVLQAFREIRRCEPKPGRSITKETPSYVEPDIVVKKVDNALLYFLNEGDLRHLRINNYYKHLLNSAENLKNKEREYYREKYRSAVWLIRNIERRKGTILRVTEAIMEFQKEFLEKGPEFIRPLTLREIAEVVGMHEATIARVTASKYVETPRGVFPLKYFFSSSLDRNDGSSASSRSVKEIIRKMVAEEDPNAPLSDSAIAKTLKDRGFEIARRTVAKYRDSLKILPANLRRKTPRP
jgi:RNA polymerase sigma-54 factor